MAIFLIMVSVACCAATIGAFIGYRVGWDEACAGRAPGLDALDRTVRRVQEGQR